MFVNLVLSLWMQSIAMFRSVVHTLCLALDSRWLQLTDLRELPSSLLRHKAQHYSLGCLGKRKYKKMIGLKESQ